jgi:hypothetical protein
MHELLRSNETPPQTDEMYCVVVTSHKIGADVAQPA